MRRNCLIGVFLIIVISFSLQGEAAPVDNEADAALYRASDEFIDGYLAWRPAMGVTLGLHQFDGKTTDYRRASLDAELARLKKADRALNSIPVQKLSRQGGADYRLLQSAIRKELFKFQDLHAYTRNPMSYPDALDVNIYIKRDFAPLTNRVQSIIAILKQAPAVFAAARANLDETLPRPFVETAIQVAEGTADFLSKDVVTTLKDLKDESLRSQFNSANQVAISELRSYVTWLKNDKLPKAKDNFAIGRSKYVRMLHEGELIDLPPESILELGLKALRAEQATLASAAQKIDATRKPLDVLKDIQKDHPTAENLIPDTRKNLEAIRQFLIDRHIITVPSPVRARVEETPQFARATSFASMDTPGPFETKATEAYYYVTPVESDWTPKQKDEWLTAFNFYTTDVVSIHEAYPGHYVQFLCLNASSANRLEKIFSSYAFVEGWAHYTEQMMLDEGFGPNMPSAAGRSSDVTAAKYRLAQSDEALLRLCRLCCSIKLHCQGMSVDEATKFFRENCYYEEKPARQEAIRGTFDPEYLYYTLGKLMIFKLRHDWQVQEGTGYTLQRFHDEMLRHGAPPLPLLRDLMLTKPSKASDLF